MTPQEQNFVSRIIEISELLIDLYADLKRIEAEWTLNNFASITDADLQSIPAFQHITDAELNAALVGLHELLTSLGTYEIGTVSDFVKLRG